MVKNTHNKYSAALVKSAFSIMFTNEITNNMFLYKTQQLKSVCKVIALSHHSKASLVWLLVPHGSKHLRTLFIHPENTENQLNRKLATCKPSPLWHLDHFPVSVGCRLKLEVNPS